MSIKKCCSLLLAASMLMSMYCPMAKAEDEYDFKIEAESTKNTNWKSVTGAVVQNNAKYSGGKYLMLAQPTDGTKEWYVEYEIEADKAGVYSMDVASTPLSSSWTSAFYVSVNGGKGIRVTGDKYANIPDDWSIMWHHVNSVNLRQGANTLRFYVKDAVASSGNAVCYLDWFGLKETEYTLSGIDSDAPFQTFQKGETLKFTIFGSGIAPEDAKVSYEILDYNGKLTDAGSVVIKKGENSAEFTLSDKPNGAYQIIASYNGRSIVQQFLITVNKNKRRDIEDSPFALDALPYGVMNDINSSLIEDFCDLLEITGVKWIRDRIYYDPYVKKNGNKYEFTMPFAEKTGKLLAERGMKVSMSMDNLPAELRSTGYGKKLSTNLFDVYEFYKQLSEKYDGAVHCWEVLNEHDLGGASSGLDGADVYASMFKAAALGVMDSETENEVYISPFGAASAADHPGRYLELLYRNDMFNYTDINNYHAHTTMKEPYDAYYPGRSAERTPAYLEMQERLEVSPTNWNGETGMTMSIPRERDYDSEEQMVQAKFLVTSFIDDIADGADKRFFFDGINFQEGGKAWGMTNRSKQYQAAYAAYGTLTAMTYALGEGEYINVIRDMPENVAAHAFNDGGDTVIVFYSKDKAGEKIPVKFDTGKKQAKIIDIFGNEQLAYQEDGSYELLAEDCAKYLRVSGSIDTGIISDAPIAPHRAMPDTQKKASDADRVILLQQYGEKQRNGARLGGYKLTDDVNTVTVAVYNFNDYEITGDIIGSSESGWKITPNNQKITVAPMEMKEVTFEVEPDGFKNQQDLITFYGDFNCGTTSRTTVWANSKEVVAAKPFLEDGEQYVIVTLENRTNEVKTVDSIELTANSVYKKYETDEVIEAKSSKQVKIPIDFADGEKSMRLSAKVNFADGVVCEFVDDVYYVIAPNRIDTTKEPDMILPDDGTIQSAMYYGRADLYGKIWVAADEKNFYMTLVAEDNIHSAPYTDSSAWQSDGLQFAIGQGLPSAGIPYFELGMSLTKENGAEMYCWTDLFGGNRDGVFNGASYNITRNENDKTTTYELTLPWDAIAPVSFEDNSMAFSLLINENDGMGRTGYIEWGSGIGGTKNPGEFRTILFSK